MRRAQTPSQVYALRFDGITLHYIGGDCNVCGRDWCRGFADVPSRSELEARVDFLGEGAPLTAEACGASVDTASWASLRTETDQRLYAVRYHHDVAPSLSCTGLVFHHVGGGCPAGCAGRDWCAGFTYEMPTRADFERRPDFVAFASASISDPHVCARSNSSWYAARTTGDGAVFAVERVLRSPGECARRPNGLAHAARSARSSADERLYIK